MEVKIFPLSTALEQIYTPECHPGILLFSTKTRNIKCSSVLKPHNCRHSNTRFNKKKYHIYEKNERSVWKNSNRLVHSIPHCKVRTSMTPAYISFTV